MYCDSNSQESVENEVQLLITGFNNQDKLDKDVIQRHGEKRSGDEQTASR